MQKKTDGIGDFSMQQAMKMAQSDTGKALFAMLQSTQGDKLQEAMDQAATGNMDQVKQTMQEFMASPQVREMIEKMRSDGNG